MTERKAPLVVSFVHEKGTFLLYRYVGRLPRWAVYEADGARLGILGRETKRGRVIWTAEAFLHKYGSDSFKTRKEALHWLNYCRALSDYLKYPAQEAEQLLDAATHVLNSTVEDLGDALNGLRTAVDALEAAKPVWLFSK